MNIFNGQFRIRVMKVTSLTHVWLDLGGRPRIARVHITAQAGTVMTAARIKNTIRKHWSHHIFIPSVILMDEDGIVHVLKGNATVDGERIKGNAYIQGWNTIPALRQPITMLPAYAHTHIDFHGGMCHAASLYLTDNSRSPLRFQSGTVRSFWLNDDRYVEIPKLVTHE